eukprot:5448484-Pyramimonas_sp.AAC.1
MQGSMMRTRSKRFNVASDAKFEKSVLRDSPSHVRNKFLILHLSPPADPIRDQASCFDQTKATMLTTRIATTTTTN